MYVCDGPFGVRKWDIVWLYDGNEQTMTWIRDVVTKLENKQDHLNSTVGFVFFSFFPFFFYFKEMKEMKEKLTGTFFFTINLVACHYVSLGIIIYKGF